MSSPGASSSASTSMRRSSVACHGSVRGRLDTRVRASIVRPHFRVQWHVASHSRFGIAVVGP
eukprot:14979269-Alexandrium_andersonii.AAC.1